jgi:hypothetical protein
MRSRRSTLHPPHLAAFVSKQQAPSILWNLDKKQRKGEAGHQDWTSDGIEEMGPLGSHVSQH